MRALWLAASLTLLASAIEIIEPVEVGAKPGFSGNIEGSGELQQGNTDKQSYQASLKGVWDDGQEAWLAIASAARSWSRGVMDDDALFAHLRWLRPVGLTKDKTIEVFGQYQSSRVKAISSRDLVGANLRFRVSEGVDLAYLGAGVMEVYEEKSKEAAQWQARLNLYATLRHRIDEKFSLYAALYYQPCVDDVSDYDLIAEAKASYDISRSFSLAYKIRESVDSTPAANKRRTDLSQLLSFSYKFGPS